MCRLAVARQLISSDRTHLHPQASPSQTPIVGIPSNLCPSGQYLGPDLIGAVHLQNADLVHMAQMQMPDLVQNPEAVAAMLMDGPGAKVGYPGAGYGPFYDAEIVHKLQSYPAWDMQVYLQPMTATHLLV